MAEKRERPSSRPSRFRWSAGIFAVLLILALHLAQAVCAPIALALFLFVILQPVMRTLEHIHIPRGIAAVIVVLTIVVVAAFLFMQLADPVRRGIAEAPKLIGNVEQKIQSLATSIKPDGAPAQRRAPVQGTSGNIPSASDIAAPAVEVFSGIGTMVGMGVMVSVLLYFLLTMGDRFWVGVSHLLAPVADRTLVLRVARTMEQRLFRYIFTVALINTGLGILVGLGMYAIGLPDAWLWGLMATAFNFVPYIGALVGELAVAVIALLTFDSVGYALLAPLVYLGIGFLEGSVVSPMILGKQLTIRPAIILATILCGGWFWGVIGVLLAIPMLVLILVLSEHVPALEGMGKFLAC
jgi:predicted PurR-regulated permease PerM